MSREEQRRQQQQEAIQRYKRDRQKQQIKDNAQPPAYRLGQRDPQTGVYIATAPNGGTRKATPLFNTGQSQDGTLKTGYTPDGRIVLDAKNRRPVPRRLVQEEEIPAPGEPILRWVETISVGADYVADQWDLYICGGTEGRRKVGEISGPIAYSSSFPDYLYMSDLTVDNPKVASCFHLNLTGPGDDDWEIYYVEGVWISGNETSILDMVYDINFVKVTSSGNTILHTYSVDTGAASGAGYTEAYWSGNTASYIRLPTTSARPYDILRYFPKSNIFNTDGSFTTDPNPIPGGDTTFTRLYKTNPLPDVYFEFQTVITRTGFLISWTGGDSYYWNTNNDSVNINENLAFIAGNAFPSLSSSPNTIFSLKPNGTYVARAISDFYAEFPDQSGQRGFNYDPFGYINVLPNNFAITHLKASDGYPYSLTLDPEERTANVTILDSDLNGVESIDIPFTAPPDPFTVFDGYTSYWWNYSLAPALWLPDYAE